MRYLVATDSVHTTAAACDYLEPLLETDDAVVVVSVSGPEGRDGADALNVANARLLGDADVQTELVEPEEGSDTTSAVLAAANRLDVDVAVVGLHAGEPGAGPTLGSTARRVVEGADVPVVVVPLSL